MNVLTKEQGCAAWETIWENSVTGLAIFNTDLVCIGVNPQFVDSCGITEADITGKQLLQLVAQEHAILHQSNCNLIKKTQSGSYKINTVLHFRTNYTLPVLMYMCGVKMKDKSQFFYILRVLNTKKKSKTSLWINKFIDKKKIFWTLITAVTVAIIAVLKKVLSIT